MGNWWHQRQTCSTLVNNKTQVTSLTFTKTELISSGDNNIPWILLLDCQLSESRNYKPVMKIMEYEKKTHQIISTQCFNILKYYTHPQIYALIKQLRREHVNVVVDHLKKKTGIKAQVITKRHGHSKVKRQRKWRIVCRWIWDVFLFHTDTLEI